MKKWDMWEITIGHLVPSNLLKSIQIHKKVIRKILGFLNILVGIVLSIFSYACIKIISPLICIRIGEIETRAIGHLCGFEVFLCEKKMLITYQKKTIDIFYKNKHVCNTLIYKKLSQDLNIVPSIFIEQLFIYLQNNNPNSKHLVPYRHWRSNKFWQRADKYNVTSKLPSQLVFSENEIRQGEEFLVEVGIRPTDKYVCIFSRGPEYYKDDSPRNSSINGYIKAIKWLISQGYKIVRVGDSATEKLKFMHESVVDYSCNYNNKTELKGIYTIKRCEYMISTSSGLDHVAQIFRKKCLYVNYSDWGTLELQNSNQLPVFIPKKLIWKESGAYVSGSDILRLNANSFWKKSMYDDNGISVVDNSEDEILGAVIEMTLRNDGKFRLSNFEYEIQNQFKNKFRSNFIKNIDLIPNISNKFLLENLYLID